MPLRWMAALTSTALRLVGEPMFRLAGRGPQGTTRRLKDYNRVLVVRTDEIGDVVMTSGLLRELRANLPDARITLVVKAQTLGLVRSCPHVDEVIAYEWKESGLIGAGRSLIAALTLARTALWPKRFDLAILPRWNTDYYSASHLVYMSGAARRVAYSERVSSRKSRLNAGYDGLFTDLIDDDTPRHEVERNLDVLRFLGGAVNSDALEIWTGPEDVRSAQVRLVAAGVSSDERIVALGVGSRHAKKVWPAENFLAVARWLHEEHGARLLVVGDRSDADTGRFLADALGRAVIDVTGQTCLGELAELLKRADLFLGNDSGPKHIAAAAGVPVVEVSWHPLSGNAADEYSPTSFRPWRVPGEVVQPETALAPCTDTCRADVAHCITRVSVEQVKDAVARSLFQKAGRRSP